MDIIKQLAYILGFSLLGQIIEKTTHIPVPASVIGLVLLFIALQTNLIHINKIDVTSKFLTDNLAILFIPAGVAIMVNFKYIKSTWLTLLLICFVSTIVSLAIVGKLTQYLILKGENKNDTRNN